LFLSLVLQDYRIPVCAQLLVMMVIAGRLLLLGFVFKPVSWLAGDSRLGQTFSLRIRLIERQSLSPICPSTIVSYFRSPEASLSTSLSRSIAGPIVFSLDRNKPVTEREFGSCPEWGPCTSAFRGHQSSRTRKSSKTKTKWVTSTKGWSTLCL